MVVGVDGKVTTSPENWEM